MRTFPDMKDVILALVMLPHLLLRRIRIDDGEDILGLGHFSLAGLGYRFLNSLCSNVNFGGRTRVLRRWLRCTSKREFRRRNRNVFIHRFNS